MGNRRGFSIMEMVVVVAIVGVLSTITIQRIGPAKSQYSVRSSRTALATMVQRARAHAVEGAGLTRLVMDNVNDVAYLIQGADTLETLRVSDEFDADMSTSGGANAEWICMNSKGYADTRCTSFSNRLTVSFTINEYSDSLAILPMGQVIY